MKIPYDEEKWGCATKTYCESVINNQHISVTQPELLELSFTRLAKCHLECGDIRYARDTYNTCLSIFPDNIIAKNAISRILESRISEVCYNDLDAEISAHLVLMSKISWFLNHKSHAHELLAKAKAITSDINDWNRLGAAYRRLEDYHNAFECYRKALSLEVNLVSYVGEAACHMDLCDLNQAYEVLAAASTKFPKAKSNRYFLRVLGRYKQLTGNEKEANQHFISAIIIEDYESQFEIS